MSVIGASANQRSSFFLVDQSTHSSCDDCLMEKSIFSTFGGLVLFQDVVEVAEELFLVDPPLIPGGCKSQRQNALIPGGCKRKLKAMCSSNKQRGAQ